MKTSKKLLSGCVALAVGLIFTGCNSNPKSETTTSVTTTNSSTNTSGLKIAYVEVDSLLSKYNFCIEMNEEMVKKEENVRATLNDKKKQLENEQKEFQYKYENNAYTQNRAQEEYNRLMKKAQELDMLQARLAEELAVESQKNTLQLRDSIKNFLEIYNKEKQYSFILSNTGFDNLLYADQAYNITDEIVEGLNKRYTKNK